MGTVVDEVAVVQRSSTSHAARVRRRGRVLDELPALGGVLATGEASGEHVDAVAGALSGLRAVVREHLVRGHADEVAEWAAGVDPNELSSRVRALGDRIAGDAGTSRRARQRRDSRARMWIDRHTQMSRLHATWDPATGVRIHQRVDHTVEQLFHDRIPGDAPDDPGERQDYLRALAIADLLLADGGPGGSAPEDSGPGGDGRGRDGRGGDGRGGDGRSGRGGGRGGVVGEIVVIIDERTLRDGREHSDTLIDVPGPIDPTEIGVDDVRDWLAEPGAVVVPTVVDADGVVTTVGAAIPARAALVPTDAPGELAWDERRLGRSLRRAARLDLGRATRLASHAQRIALRVMHPTCGLPGCSTRFEHCAPHHVRWWGHDGGTTDLGNLVPVCVRQHADLHQGHVELTLHRDRRITVTTPDGRRLERLPPSAHHDQLRARRRAAREPP